MFECFAQNNFKDKNFKTFREKNEKHLGKKNYDKAVQKLIGK